MLPENPQTSQNELVADLLEGPVPLFRGAGCEAGGATAQEVSKLGGVSEVPVSDQVRFLLEVRQDSRSVGGVVQEGTSVRLDPLQATRQGGPFVAGKGVEGLTVEVRGHGL